MAIDLSIRINPNGTVSVGLTLVSLIVDIFKYAIVSIFSILIYKYYHAHSRWGEAMWLRDSAGQFRSLFASGQRVNGLNNFSGWHLIAVGFSATLFILGFSGTLLTTLFSTEPLNIDVFSNDVLITSPVWNASYNASALLSTQDAYNAAFSFVRLLSNTQQLNLSSISLELDPDPTKVTPLNIYSSVTTLNGTTTVTSGNISLISVYSGCDGLLVEYQNTSSGAFRGYPASCSNQDTDQYFFDFDFRPYCGAGSIIYLTRDSWGQLLWEPNAAPTAKMQQRELLTQVNGSTIRVSETYSTFDSVTTATFDVAGAQNLCISLMSVHRDAFDAGLCSNMTENDVDAFQAMDLQYDAKNEAVMVRYCIVNLARSDVPGSLVRYLVGCIDYIVQLFSIQSEGIQDGAGEGNIFFPTAAGSNMLSIRTDGVMYNLNYTEAQNTVLQVNSASSASIQKFVPHQSAFESSTTAADLSLIHADTRDVPAAQTLYTTLLAKTLSDWQRPQPRAPVGLYRRTDDRPWIHTATLGTAIAISILFFILALCIEFWCLPLYYTSSFMNSIRIMTYAEGLPRKVFADIQESDNGGEPAIVTLNSRRLILGDVQGNVENDFLLWGRR